MVCGKCGLEMSMRGMQSKRRQVSVNRKVNTLAHTKGNCELVCLQCNVTLKDRDCA
jgi:hypothetical protein